MAPSPCLDCGTLTTTTRCTTCQQAADQQRNARRTHYHGNWTTLSRTTRDAWVAQHGWTCPGYGTTPPHPARNLTLDHTTGRVLCLPCNIAAGPR